MSLSQKALLISLNVSQWTGRRLDRTATHTVETSHATDGHVGNYHKRLLPGCDALTAIQKHVGLIRTFYYAETLPWLADGSRILASQNYLLFTERLKPLIDQFDALVAQLIAEYPVEVQRAQNRLGTLFNPSEYPSPAMLRTYFAISTTFFPVPDASDFRVQILDSERATFESRMADAERAALTDCYARLQDVIAKAIARLSSPDAIFRDSLIENIREVCDVLPRLDFSNDPKLADFRARTESAISGLTADTLRNSETQRTKAAQNLAQIMSGMGALMASNESGAA